MGKHFFSTLLFVGLCCLFTTIARAENVGIKGQFLAIGKAGITEQKLAQSLKGQGYRVSKIRGSSRLFFIKKINTQKMKNIAPPKSEFLDQVEGDYFLPVTHEQTMFNQPMGELANENRTIPDDPDFVKQWPLYNTKGGYDMSATLAWNIRTETAPEVIVAVIDSGIDLNHPDLKANLWVNEDEIPGNKIDDDHNGYIDDVYGADTHLGTGDPMDTLGHGTQVAGIIGAVGNNGIGTSGVIWKTKIMAIRAEDGTKRISYSGAVKGGYYAAANGAKVVNCSCGTFTAAMSIKEMIQDLDRQGVIFVGAVGNVDNNIDTQYLEYPAAFRLPNMIEVTAIDQDNELTPKANYGRKWVNIAAPGWRITTPALGGGYKTDYGTSLAAPFVTATVAMVMSEFPQLNHYEVRQKVLNAVDVIPSLADKVGTSGRVNLLKALSP